MPQINPLGRHLRKTLIPIVLFSLLVTAFFVIIPNVFADELDQINKEKEEKTKEYQSVESQLNKVQGKITDINSKVATLLKSLNLTQSQISDLQSDINDLEAQLNKIKKELDEKNKALSQKIILRNSVLRSFAKHSNLNEFEIFLLNLPEGLNGFQYAAFTQTLQKSLTSETVSIIGVINSEISTFEKDKKEAENAKQQLEQSKKELVTLKANLDAQKLAEQKRLNDAKSQASSLEGKLADLSKAIAELTSKQQDLINQKSGEGNGTVGDYAQSATSLPSPGYSPAFAAASYGAFTHGNGMSQYGAKGRADAGQSYKDILKFYYKVGVKTVSDFPKTIKVSGQGEMDFQKYLYGIAEMPSDWPDDALKAQAIAARTYAYKAGKPICVTESCQVFLKSKSDNPPSKWKKAVDDTKGMILDGASTAQYSSTTGGYVNNVGWDKSGTWPGDAYEKKAGSPWFFKAWFTKSYSTSSDKCGLSTPWLNKEQMADILNSWVVWRKGSFSEKGHISPVTTSCWGGDPYSMKEMADKADDYDSKFTDVTSDVDVEISSNGYTSKVTFNTNRGKVSIDGAEFKAVFNLRAPGYISIKNKLFDFVTK